LFGGGKMKREKYAEWWATPPKIAGPLIVLVICVWAVLAFVFLLAGNLPAAGVTCQIGAVLLLAALLDLVAELIRYQRLMLERLETKSHDKTGGEEG
jgi:hypothetical protein